MLIAGVVTLLGLALAAPAHCEQVADVAALVAELRTEVRAVRADVGRLVAAAERAAERRPVYMPDLEPVRAEARAQVGEARGELRQHGERITALERSYWYLVGAGVVAAALAAAVWRSMALQVRVKGPPGDHAKPP